jgi:hypothetical protein
MKCEIFICIIFVMVYVRICLFFDLYAQKLHGLAGDFICFNCKPLFFFEP